MKARATERLTFNVKNGFVDVFIWNILRLKIHIKMKIARYKKAQKTLSFYRNNFGFREPYQILIDATFCQTALIVRIFHLLFFVFRFTLEKIVFCFCFCEL